MKTILAILILGIVVSMTMLSMRDRGSKARDTDQQIADVVVAKTVEMDPQPVAEVPVQVVQQPVVTNATSVVIVDKGATFQVMPRSKDSSRPVAPANPYLKK